MVYSESILKFQDCFVLLQNYNSFVKKKKEEEEAKDTKRGREEADGNKPKGKRGKATNKPL